MGYMCLPELKGEQLHYDPDTTGNSSAPKFSVMAGTSLWLGGEINRDNFIYQSARSVDAMAGIHMLPAWNAGLQLNVVVEHEVVFINPGLYTEFLARPEGNSMYFGFSGGIVFPELRSNAAAGYNKTNGWYMQPGLGYRISLCPCGIYGRLGFKLQHQKTAYLYDHAFLGQVEALSDRSYLVFSVAIGGR